MNNFQRDMQIPMPSPSLHDALMDQEPRQDDPVLTEAEASIEVYEKARADMVAHRDSLLALHNRVQVAIDRIDAVVPPRTSKLMPVQAELRQTQHAHLIRLLLEWRGAGPPTRRQLFDLLLTAQGAYPQLRGKNYEAFSALCSYAVKHGFLRETTASRFLHVTDKGRAYVNCRRAPEVLESRPRGERT